MRTHYLIIPICCFIIGLLLTLCMGCYHSWPVTDRHKTVIYNCKDRAELCRKVVEEHGIKTRKVYGLANSKNTFHVQNQALINDKWQWLDTDGKEVFIGEQDHWFEPQYYNGMNLFDRE